MVAASRLLLSAESAVSAMAEAQAAPVLRSPGHGEPSFALRTVRVAVHLLHLRDEPKSTRTNPKWLYQAIAQYLSNGTDSHLSTGRAQAIIWILYQYDFRCFEKTSATSIGHFRVSLSLSFKASLSAKFVMIISSNFHMNEN